VEDHQGSRREELGQMPAAKLPKLVLSVEVAGVLLPVVVEAAGMVLAVGVAVAASTRYGVFVIWN
jgi:hypothetical protein